MSNISVVFNTLHSFISYFIILHTRTPYPLPHPTSSISTSYILINPSSSAPPTLSPWHVKMTSITPRQELPQTCWVIKLVYPVWIRPTDNLKSHPKTSFRINWRWSDQCQCTAPLTHFISELINNWWILCTTNRHSIHNVPQACGSSK